MVVAFPSALYRRNLRHILRPTTSTKITRAIEHINAITGAAIAKIDIIPAPAVSVVATTEFPRPPVVAVEAALVPANHELIAAAVPPPAINAKAHWGKVPISAN